MQLAVQFGGECSLEKKHMKNTNSPQKNRFRYITTARQLYKSHKWKHRAENGKQTKWILVPQFCPKDHHDRDNRATLEAMNVIKDNHFYTLTISKRVDLLKLHENSNRFSDESIKATHTNSTQTD